MSAISYPPTRRDEQHVDVYKSNKHGEVNVQDRESCCHPQTELSGPLSQRAQAAWAEEMGLLSSTSLRSAGVELTIFPSFDLHR